MARYEEITDFDLIKAGSKGEVEGAENAINFLAYWGDWIAQVIEAIKSFLEYIGISLG